MGRGRKPEPYLLKKKDGGKYYYYKLPGMKSFVSTHLTNERDSREFVIEKIKEIDRENGKINPNEMTFGKYSKDYFIWEKCPHFTRISSYRTKDQPVSKRYCSECRRLLTTKIQPTFFWNLKIVDIKRYDVLNLQKELQKTNTNGVVNDCLTTINLIFNEGMYREELTYNPAAGIRKLPENTKDKIPYTKEDYEKMFPIDNEEELIRIWKTFTDFMVEYIECNTGMRNGEVRCLKWKNVDLNNRTIKIEETFKDDYNKEVGLPKNGTKRLMGICDNLYKMFVLYKEKYTNYTDPEDYVCCLQKSGIPLMKKHTRIRHREGLKKVGVEYRGQHIYRHTFNSFLMNDPDLEKIYLRIAAGWKDERVQKGYTHIEEEAAKSISEGQNRFWNK